MEAIPRDYGQGQFDAFCKKVLKNEARAYLRNMKRQRDRETMFSDLPQHELDKLCTVDRYPSDYFVRNASYLKCSNMTLGYSFPALIKAGAEKICSGRIFFTVQNPFIITKYKGIDPEVSSGIDSNPYPRPISFQLGLNLNF